jgi:hypothetical protein
VSCANGSCAFFAGLPCLQQDVYPDSRAHCDEFLRTRRSWLLEQTTIAAAPFVHCSIYSGALGAKLCAPHLKPRQLAIYRVSD